MSEIKPYHRLEGEPNIWFDRFRKFMQMGSNRTLARCYREVRNAERTKQGLPPLSPKAKSPHNWRQYAKEYCWSARAEAWDQEIRCQDLENVELAFSMTRELVPEAIQILAAAMRGELRDPDGKLTEGQNCTQRRLAADSLLDRAGVIHDRPAADDDPDIIGIKIMDYEDDEDLDHDDLNHDDEDHDDIEDDGNDKDDDQ